MNSIREIRQDKLAWKEWGFLIIAVVFLLQSCIGENRGECGDIFYTRSAPLQDPLTIIDSSSHIELTQDIEDAFIKDIVLKDGTAFITGSFSETESDKFISFNTLTTQPNWTICRQSTGMVAVSETAVYLWGGDPGLVIALDKESGYVDWQRNVDFKYPIIDAIDITPLGLLIESRTRTGTRFHLLDEETGKKLITFQSNAEKQDYWISNGYTIFLSEDKVVKNVGPISWETYLDFKSYSLDEPTQLIVTDDVVLVSKIHRNNVQLASLDKTSGKILWELDTNLISNLSVMDDLLFIVSNSEETNEVRLLSFDLKSGEIIHYVTFSPDIQQFSGEATEAIISADSNQTLVYFPNTYQLFDFHIKN